MNYILTFLKYLFAFLEFFKARTPHMRRQMPGIQLATCRRHVMRGHLHTLAPRGKLFGLLYSSVYWPG